MQGFSSISRHRQRGVVALAIALLIVVVTTVVTVGVAKIGVGEQRNMANELRNQEAAAAAEAGLERGVMYIRQNRRLVRATVAGGWMDPTDEKWVVCAGTDTSTPCGDGSANTFDDNWTAYENVPNLFPSGDPLAGRVTVHYVARAASAGANAPGRTVYYVVADATSADGSARVLARKALSFAPLIARRPDAPLIAAGTIGANGTISVIANPNGGGTGVPLSAWSGNDVSLAGSMQTCYIAEYLSTDADYTTATDSAGSSITMCPDCVCPNTATLRISSSGDEDIDILDIDNDAEGVNPDSTNFPNDVFEYVFGTPWSNYETIKEEAEIITDCNTLGPTSSGLYWVSVDCNIASNTTVGSLDAPVLLVVENSDFRMNNNNQFFGLIFSFANPPDTGTVSVSLTGGPTLYGSMISNQDIDIGNGNFKARYDATTLNNLANGANSIPLISSVPGSWRDF